MNKNISTIFFDIGGVLLNIHPEKTFQHLSDCSGISVNEIKNRFPMDAHEEYEKGNLTNKEWFFAVKKSISDFFSLKESDFWKAWGLLLGQEKKSIKLLKKLKDYYSVWLLSNTNSYHIQNEIKEKFKFPHLVNGAIYSFEVRVRKPDEEIYKIAASKAGSIPERCLFIDDIFENVIVAKDLGFIGIHFKSFNQLEEDLYNIGVLVKRNIII